MISKLLRTLHMRQPVPLLFPLVFLGLIGVGPLVARQRILPAGTTDTAFISGQVLEGETTKPVPGATVTLRSFAPRGPLRDVIADAQGRYVFSGLPAGEFRLTARKAGWREGAFGLDTPTVGIAEFGEPIRLTAGERAVANVQVWRNALIRGRVTDESGEPLADARVSARERSGLGSGDLGITDDRGYFTLSVPPGEYMLASASEQVRIVKARPQVFRQTFYPSSSTASGASTVTVQWGEEKNGLEIRMPLEPAFRIAGILNRIDAGRMPAQFELLRIDPETNWQYPRRAIDAQGRFAFDNIPAGRYVLQTPKGGPQAPSDNMEVWARVAVDVVDRDLDLSIDLRRRWIVSGRIRFEGAVPQPGPGDSLQVGVRLFREDELPLTDVIPAYTPAAADGSFALAVTPGRYVVSAVATLTNLQVPRPGEPGRSWILRTAAFGRSDAADVPLVVTGDVSGLELTFTDKQSNLRGRVTSRQGRVESAQLMVFPTDESLWEEFPVGRRFRSMRLSADGTFELRGLPEGDYFLAAARGAPQNAAWMTPSFLDALARSARRIVLPAGQTITRDIELIEAPAYDPEPARAVAAEPAGRAIIREAAAGEPSKEATISGAVIAADSNAPIPGARVGLTSGVAGTPNIGGTYTDDRGQFVLAGVPPGTYTLYVSRPLYVSTALGATRPNDPGTRVTVTDGQQLSGLTIPLIRGAAIGGTTVDHNGQPIPGVRITVSEYRWTARGRELVAPQPPVRPTTSNQKGEYRIYGLPPGDYVIQAATQGMNSALRLTTQADLDAVTRPADSGAPQSIGAAASPAVDVTYSYTPMFYPNTPDPALAQTVRLEPGDDRVIDFQFGWIPTSTVMGTVRTADGPAPNRLSVTLTPNDPLSGTAPRSRFGTVDSTGAFTIREVPPGRYVLTTSQVLAGSDPLAGALELFVDRDLSGVVLDVSPMSTVAGTVRGDVTAALRQPNVRISLSPLPGTLVGPNQTRSAVIGQDNSFSIANVPPGRYRFEFTAPINVVKPRIAMRAINGVGAADSALDVKSGETIHVDVEIMTSEAQVGGRLHGRDGQPATDLYVVLFAKDSQDWTPPLPRVFGLRPNQNGRYVFPDVPAGDYLIVPLDGIDPGEWFDPALLSRLSTTAAPLTVHRGDSLEIDLETP